MTDMQSAAWRERLMAAYGLPADTLVGARRPGRHVMRPVSAGGRRFLLKAVPAGSGTVERLRRELAFQRNLARLDGPAPRPLERVDIPGEMLVDHPCEGVGAVYEHLPGRPCRACPDDAESAGRALATLHLLADGDADAQGAVPDGRDLLLDRPARAIRDLLGRRMPDAAQALADRLGGWLDHLPKEAGAFGACHGDSHHENAIIDGEGRVRYVDFEHAVPTWRAYDLATFIWGTFRIERGAAVWHRFMIGYSGVRRPDEVETTWIRPFLAVRQLWWLGFTIGATPPGTASLPGLVEEGLAFALRLAEDLDLQAVIGDGGGRR